MQEWESFRKVQDIRNRITHYKFHFVNDGCMPQYYKWKMPNSIESPYEKGKDNLPALGEMFTKTWMLEAWSNAQRIVQYTAAKAGCIIQEDIGLLVCNGKDGKATYIVKNDDDINPNAI